MTNDPQQSSDLVILFAVCTRSALLYGDWIGFGEYEGSTVFCWISSNGQQSETNISVTLSNIAGSEESGLQLITYII